MKSHIKKLVVIAHPDDEVIFFSQVIIPSAKEVHLVLVTDGNGDGDSNSRISAFKSVLKHLGIESFECWNFIDDYENIFDHLEFNILLKNTLSQLNSLEEIYTHGPLGEYGHPHHIQVSKLIHSSDSISHLKVYHPDILGIDSTHIIRLDDTQWKKAAEIMTSQYKSEYERFYYLLPINKSRSYLADKNYVSEVIKYCSSKCFSKQEEEEKLGPYGPYRDILKIMRSKLKRPF